jgi:ubiquinone/menaquinone biosynthesis C-methylase UbiE
MTDVGPRVRGHGCFQTKRACAYCFGGNIARRESHHLHSQESITSNYRTPSDMTRKQETTYALGHSEAELQRLILQAGIVGRISERLLREAGLREGMRVLDLGSGAGDISMLAADIVGPFGSVVGVDRNQQAVELARRRAKDGGCSQIVSKVCSVEDLNETASFDFVVGRYVLVHQADPLGFLRSAAKAIRPGGVIAFHENTPPISARSYPPLEIYDHLADLITAAAVFNLPHGDAALRAPQLFQDAGLPYPTLFSETPIGGAENSSICEWTVELHRALRPQYEKAGIVIPETFDPEKIKDRLKAAAIQSRSLLMMPMQICFWAGI